MPPRKSFCSGIAFETIFGPTSLTSLGRSIFVALRLLLLLGMTHISRHDVFQSLVVNPVQHVDGDCVGGLSRLLIWSQVQVHRQSSQVL